MRRDGLQPTDRLGVDPELLGLAQAHPGAEQARRHGDQDEGRGDADDVRAPDDGAGDLAPDALSLIHI